MTIRFRAVQASCFLSCLLACLAACTPRFDWREVHGTDAPYSILMPAKPASHPRTINLDGPQVAMTMDAADIDGAMFAVGTATLPDADAANHALAAMKTALVRNLGATVTKEQANASAGNATIDIEAVSNAGQPRVLYAHLVAHDRRVYQVVAIGSEKALPRDAVDTFLTSFKLN